MAVDNAAPQVGTNVTFRLTLSNDGDYSPASNVVVDDGPGQAEVTVQSNLVVRQARKLRDEAWWVGRRTDVLRRAGSGEVMR